MLDEIQVGIAKEKIVNIGRLSDVTAAELFVASAPREVMAIPCYGCNWHLL